MANEIKKGARKAGQTIGRKGKATSGFIQAGSAITKRTSKQTNQAKPGAPKVSTYKEYLDMTPNEVAKLKTSELRGVVARLNKVEGKRLKNLEKYGFGEGGYNIQAYRDLTEAGGKTKASKDMTRNELLHEYKRAKAFLTSETGSVQGAKNFLKGIQNIVGADEPLSKDQITMLYDIYHKYEDSGAMNFYKKGEKKSAGYQEALNVQRGIYDKIKAGMSEDDILVDLGILSETENNAIQDTSDDYNFTGYHHP